MERELSVLLPGHSFCSKEAGSLTPASFVEPSPCHRQQSRLAALGV